MVRLVIRVLLPKLRFIEVSRPLGLELQIEHTLLRRIATRVQPEALDLQPEILQLPTRR